MSDQLSDDRLIRLLEERPGRDLTDAEFKHIASRVADSAGLQKALLDRAIVDERIAKQLAVTQLPLHVFVANATKAKHSFPIPLRNAAIGLGIACFLIGVATTYLFVSDSDNVTPLAQVGNPQAKTSDVDVVGKSLKESTASLNKTDASPTVVKSAVDANSTEPASTAVTETAQPTAPAGVPAIPAIEQAESKPPWSVALTEKPKPFEEIAFQPQALDGLDSNVLREWLEPIASQAYRVERRNHANRPFSRFTGVAQLRPTWPKDGVLRLGLYQPSDMRFHFWAGKEGVTFRFVPPIQTWLAFRSYREDESALPDRYALVASDEGRHQRTSLGVFEIRHQDQHLILSRGDVVLMAAPMTASPAQVVLDGSTYVSQFKLYRSTSLPHQPEIDEDRIARNVDRPADLEWFVASTKPETNPAEPTRRVLRTARKLEELPPPKPDANNPKDADKPKLPKPWRVPLADTNQLAGHTGGAVELFAEFNPTELQAASFLNDVGSPQSALTEVCFKVDHADAGTGFFLGDEFGKPIERIGFYEERTTGLIIVGHRPAGNATTAVTYNPTSQRITSIAAGSWIRIGIGLGGLKLWVSGDGMHWSRALSSPIRTVFMRPTSFGLYALPGTKRRRLQLAQLQIRELTGLTNLASAKVRRRVPKIPLDEQSGLADWLHHSLQSQPTNVDTNEWTRACAIRAIEQNASRHLTATLLERLIDQAIRSPLKPAKAKAMLDDFALFSDGWDQLGTTIAARYHGWGHRFAGRDENATFEDTATNLIGAPIWTNVKLPIVEHPLLHTTLLSRVYNQDWLAVRHACERMRFWRQSSHPDENWTQTAAQQRQIVEWAEAIAWSHLRGREDATELAKTSSTPPPANLMDRWQQPLVWDMSKEAYNLMAEFESALKSEAWQDAAQIIGTAASDPQEFQTDEDVLLGLLPDWNQQSLLVSLPVAVQLAVKQYRGLRNVMREELGPRGLLRVQQSIEAGNAKDVESATLQYYGTPAAALAHEWLGDRAISLGKFDVAVREYRRAIPEASPAVVQSLQSRLRLAFALAGQAVAVEGTEDMPLPAPQEAVVLGESSMTGRSFMNLITDIANSRNEVTSELTATAIESLQTAPPLGDYKIEITDTFNGNMGRSPGQSGYQLTDWAGRQLAVAADEQLMVVSNRFQIASFDVKTGKKRNAWTMAKPATAHDWTLLPMQPLIAGDRIYVRWLEQSSPQLACLDRNSNTVIWAKKADGYVASDPVILGGKLKAIIAKSLGNGIVRFDLATFDPTTGDITDLRPFVRQRDKWAMKPNIQVLVHDGRLLCSFDSILVSLDEDGTPRWLNQQTWLPREIDSQWIHRSHSPIVVQDDLLFVVQSASRQLSCFDASTGRQKWTAGLPDIRRLIGLAGTRILVETDAGFSAFSVKRGRLQWTLDVPADERLHAAASDFNGFVFGRRVNNGTKGSTAALVWVDGESGNIQRTVTLDGLTDPKHSLFLGPLVITGETAWTFFGTEWNKPERQLIRLKPAKTNHAIARLGSAKEAASAWIDSTENSRINLRQVLGDWTLATRQSVSGQFDGAEVVSDFRGEKDSLHTRMIQGHAVRFARRIDVPKAGKASLEIRVGHVAGKRWVLAVEAAGTQLTRTVIDDTSAPSGWKQLRLDLTPFAGKSIWLGVSQQAEEATQQQPNDAYWKRLAIVQD